MVKCSTYKFAFFLISNNDLYCFERYKSLCSCVWMVWIQMGKSFNKCLVLLLLLLLVLELNWKLYYGHSSSLFHVSYLKVNKDTVKKLSKETWTNFIKTKGKVLLFVPVVLFYSASIVCHWMLSVNTCYFWYPKVTCEIGWSVCWLVALRSVQAYCLRNLLSPLPTSSQILDNLKVNKKLVMKPKRK